MIFLDHLQPYYTRAVQYGHYIVQNPRNFMCATLILNEVVLITSSLTLSEGPLYNTVRIIAVTGIIFSTIALIAD